MARPYHVTWRTLAVALIAALAFAPLALAKKKSEGGVKIKGKLVEISVTDAELRMPAEIKHGWTTFRVANDGTVPHSLHARNPKKLWVLVASLPPGQAALVPIKLKKGAYTIWEPLPPNAPADAQPTLQAALTVN